MSDQHIEDIPLPRPVTIDVARAPARRLPVAAPREQALAPEPIGAPVGPVPGGGRPGPATYRWRLKQVMKARGVASARQLTRMLAEVGVEVNNTTVLRLIAGPKGKVTLQVLAGLCLALRCTPSDLISIVIHERARASLPTRSADAALPLPTPVRLVP